MTDDINTTHICDRCYRVFEDEIIAHYRVKGILIDYSYYCLNHAVDNYQSNPNTIFEYSESGLIKDYKKE